MGEQALQVDTSMFSSIGYWSYVVCTNRYLDYVISCLPACVAGVSGVLLAPALANIRQRRMRIVVASRTINMIRISVYLEELFSRSLKLSTSLLMSGIILIS